MPACKNMLIKMVKILIAAAIYYINVMSLSRILIMALNLIATWGYRADKAMQ